MTDDAAQRTKTTRRRFLRATGTGLVGAASLSVPVSADTPTRTALADGVDVAMVPAAPDYGFNYPYFLHVPTPLDDQARPLLVEPNNSPQSTDDFERHRELARDLIASGTPRRISDELRLPLLVPVFPRPDSDPVDWRHEIQALDTDTMHIDDGPLERVDRQLLRMVDHARELLANLPYRVLDKFSMNGFSASAKFVNRFTALHPDRLISVTAGGISGHPILPIAEAKGYTLNYQIGIADVERFTGRAFQREAFTDVAQYIYMGVDDQNDPLPGRDTWNDTQRQISYDVYGEDMQDDRFPYSRNVYERVGANATFRLYEGVGHEITNEIENDVVAFHREHLDGRYGNPTSFDKMEAVLGVDIPETLVTGGTLAALGVGGGAYLYRRYAGDE
jgi:hypothetical protein